ncbi:hypothetical protein LguiB_033898 [Lonicera macranthoides]
MTRAVHDRILKEANGDISDHHLRNHIHLTNCIHLKNHMHNNQQSPVMADRSLIRDLVVLQRSRSLRNPSMSPHSWKHSPSGIDLRSGRGKMDVVECNGRRSVECNGRQSVESERYRDDRRFYGSSPLLACVPTPEVAHGEVSRQNDGIHDEIDRRINQMGRLSRDDNHLTTLAQQLNEVRFDGDDLASSHILHHGRHNLHEKPTEGAEVGIHSSCSGLNRVKRRKFRGARRTRATMAARDSGLQNEMSVASNSFARDVGLPTHRVEEGEEEEYAGQNVTRGPRNGCGIPWNWSRIHDRGKNILGNAGRSFSCGLSDPKLKKGGGPVPRGRDFSSMPVPSENSSSPNNFNAEAHPLLVDASCSQESTDNAAWAHDYSGELGIYADNLLNREIDSDLASEARSGDQSKFQKNCSRHQNLTQKYTPRTFRDLVGQSLVAQALLNAAAKRKVGSLYVFYGPHGTGKTSCARVFARALNCQSQDHQKPCRVCDSCILHEKGKSRNIMEVGPVGSFDFEGIMEVLARMTVSQFPSQYRVLIFDDCDSLSPDCWSAISKVIDRAPRRVVFLLIGLSLDVLPHIIVTRCQKFFFPKLKDADIIYTLQWIASKENLEIDKDALKLIASRSDGSLRDAEMTLDQLSLLGQRITVPLVQELVGLVSDEKLVDLLDLALSADTVNTVKNLREIMESGIEPLALMSQLATIITDILAGSYDFMKERLRRKFFRQALLKEDMEKLRQALKILSEAEKQLRSSNDRLTWLTAALLQLAPDQQYLLPSSSADSSFRHSPRKSNADKVRIEHHQAESSSDAYYNSKTKVGTENRVISRQFESDLRKKIEEIWFEVLEKIHVCDVKEFMYREGKLLSVSYGAAPTVQLMFTSHLTKSNAEKFRMHILQAFESVLGCPVIIEIRYALKNDARERVNVPLTLPGPQGGSSSQVYVNPAFKGLKDGNNLTQAQLLPFDFTGMGRGEIVELEGSSVELKGNELIEGIQPDRRDVEQRNLGEHQSQSLMRNKVSLAHVIQEGCTQQSGWSKRKAVSIAEKLEQENMRLEPKSRSLLCWKTESRGTRRKLSCFKIRTRKPKALLKFVPCGKCASTRSPSINIGISHADVNTMFDSVTRIRDYILD